MDNGSPKSRAAPPGLSATFVLHQLSLRRFLRRFFSRVQDIEDIAQETFLRAFDAERSGESVRSPKAFLFRIAKNVALNELARKSRCLTEYMEESAAQDVMDPSAPAEEQAIGREKLAMFCRAVASLPAQCRKAFLMRKVHGLSHKDIAEQLDISISTVEKHVASGLLRCSTYLREGGYAVDMCGVLTVCHKNETVSKNETISKRRDRSSLGHPDQNRLVVPRSGWPGARNGRDAARAHSGDG
jgi:RNA polymerase sigma factor (sigma-70 family)